MLALLAFFESPLGKLAGYVIIAILAAGVLFGGYYAWKVHVQNQAMQEFNQKQTEQADKDRKVFEEKMQKIEAVQNQILGNLQKQLDTVNEQSDILQDYLDSDEAKASDRESSAVLKETVRRLGERAKK